MSPQATRRRPPWLRRSLLLDLALAGVAAALTFGLGAGGDPARHDMDAAGVALGLAASLPAFAARRTPGAVFALTALASAAFVARGYGDPASGPLIALFFLAARAERPRENLVRAVIAVAFVLHVAAALSASSDGYSIVPPPFVAVLWLAAWVLGERLRQQRERRTERRERERRLAVAEERARIARDLHDSAGHAINVILVQAGAARLLHERDPEASRSAIATIEDVARETLVEIEHIVHALREDGGGEDVETPAGLAALEALAARHSEAGLPVSVDVHGTMRTLPRRVDLAAFRIVQEALTNSARHGAGGATVEVGFGPDALELAVTNPARPGATGGGGHGLVGMRERAALLGGSLEAGAAEGTFSVRARLPYDGASA